MVRREGGVRGRSGRGHAGPGGVNRMGGGEGMAEHAEFTGMNPGRELGIEADFQGYLRVKGEFWCHHQ